MVPTSTHATITSRTNLQFTSASIAYLPVPHPILKLSLTPFDPKDAHILVETLSDPQVALKLVGPPYPYSEQDARQWFAHQKEMNDLIWDRWEKRDFGIPEGCPVSHIRVEGGELVGVMAVKRWHYPHLVGEAQKTAAKANAARSLEDPELIWCIGYWLRPKFFGQGVATGALNALIHDYVLPVLKPKTNLMCSAFTDNPASKRVQEKCGFKEIGTFERQVAEERGGGTKTEWLLVRQESI